MDQIPVTFALTREAFDRMVHRAFGSPSGQEVGMAAAFGHVIGKKSSANRFTPLPNSLLIGNNCPALRNYSPALAKVEGKIGGQSAGTPHSHTEVGP